MRLFRDSGTIDGPDRAGNHNAATAEANGGSEEGRKSPSLITLGVIVHQASVENDFLLIVRQAFHMEHQVLYGAVRPDDPSRDILNAVLNGLADAGDEHTVAGGVVKGRVRVQREGQDSPVDAVGAIPLGGELIADVGKAPPAPSGKRPPVPGRSRRRACWQRHRSRTEWFSPARSRRPPCPEWR